MNDQIDGGTLVGGYVCTDRPGEFRWQPGSLTQVCFPFFLYYLVTSSYETNRCYYVSVYSTYEESILFHLSVLFLSQAVQNGFWIVFEDIDKAPQDVHSILTPLLEGTGSFMIANGEVVSLHFNCLFLLMNWLNSCSCLVSRGNSY